MLSRAAGQRSPGGPRSARRPRDQSGTGPVVLVALAVLSLVLRLLFWSGTEVQETVRADAYHYTYLAWSLANRGIYEDTTDPTLKAHLRWPPGYPALLAPLFRGRTQLDGTAVAQAVQVVIGAALPGPRRAPRPSLSARLARGPGRVAHRVLSGDGHHARVPRQRNNIHPAALRHAARAPAAGRAAVGRSRARGRLARGRRRPRAQRFHRDAMGARPLRLVSQPGAPPPAGGLRVRARGDHATGGLGGTQARRRGRRTDRLLHRARPRRRHLPRPRLRGLRAWLRHDGEIPRTPGSRARSAGHSPRRGGERGPTRGRTCAGTSWAGGSRCGSSTWYRARRSTSTRCVGACSVRLSSIPPARTSPSHGSTGCSGHSTGWLSRSSSSEPGSRCSVSGCRRRPDAVRSSYSTCSSPPTSFSTRS